MTSHAVRLKPRKTPADVDRSVRLILCAAAGVPFYRRALADAGVEASQIRGARDLPKLPVTRRDALLASGTRGFLGDGVDLGRLACRHTTGTTGTPLSIYMTRAESLFRTVTFLDALRRNVRLPLTFTLVDVGPERKDRSTRLAQRYGPIRVVRLFRSMPASEQAAVLLAQRPDVIEGRPSLLGQLAQELEAADLAAPRPRLIVSYAEVLYPRVRETLARVFGCRVADYYNCEEAGNLAWECPARPGVMHLNPATAVVEIVGDDGAPRAIGEEGAVVITNLFNRTMPFVRYAMGDRGAMLEPGRCACGFVGESMRLLDGRDEDFFLLPDGRQVSPRVVYDVVNTALPAVAGHQVLAQSIRAFQIIQEELDRVVVRVVPGPDYREDAWEALGANLRALHPSLRSQVVLADALETGPGGKLRQVMSRVSADRARPGAEG